MPSARCPDCDTLREITSTGEKQRAGWTAERWRIVLHRKPDSDEICDGSGRKV